MTTRSVRFSVFIMALAAAVAWGPIVAQETKPKPPAPQTTKPKPPAPETAKPKPPAPQTTKPKPPATAKPGTTQKPAAAARGGGAGPTAAVKARLRSPGKLKDVAPATFKAQFDTSSRQDWCELIKDVPGYFTADPRTASDAALIDALDYTTALEMADAGCPLVQRQAIDHARRAHLPLIVRSFDSLGTRVA